LIATVQKLYGMVRNGESWTLGEPELNDRGLPVIHNIAEKLGCIRPSPDLPCAFPEDPEEFAELQAQLAAAGRKEDQDFDHAKERGKSEEGSSHELDHDHDHDDGVMSSCESDHYSDISQNYPTMMWDVQTQPPQDPSQAYSQAQLLSSRQFENTPIYSSEEYEIDDPCPPQHRAGAVQSAFTVANPAMLPSPTYTDFQTPIGSPTGVFRGSSPFAVWAAGGEDMLGPAPLLDLTALYMSQGQQQQQQARSMSYPPALRRNILDAPTAPFCANGTGTTRPHMLDCSAGYELGPGGAGLGEMDGMVFGACERVGMSMC
jgi:hypothetical protein